MEKEIKVFVNDIEKKDMPQINDLLFQLSLNAFVKNKKLINDFSHWQEVMKRNYVFSARDMTDNSKTLVALATLIPHIQPLGRFGNIQDVVVDKKFRRNGIGTMLWENILAISKEKDLQRIELTSSKVIAQDWYKKLGFVEHKTQVLKKELF